MISRSELQFSTTIMQVQTEKTLLQWNQNSASRFTPAGSAGFAAMAQIRLYPQFRQCGTSDHTLRFVYQSRPANKARNTTTTRPSDLRSGRYGSAAHIMKADTSRAYWSTVSGTLFSWFSSVFWK